MSTAPDNRPRPTFGWRVRHSWWLLFSILGFGCLNGVGFLYIGLRARRPEWWIPGIAYLVAAWAFFVLASNLAPESAAATWFSMSWLAVWAGSLLHACLINSAWLRWRAGYVPWHAEPTVALRRGAGFSPPPPGLAPPPGYYYGPGPAAAPPGPPVEVNTAGPEQLAALPGFDPERVRRVLAEREARRGFGSVEEFAAAATLPPHEFVRIRGLVVCAPAPPRPPSPGRILDV
ncbi:ComEA family DNA-binding protein [Phytohabitans rumicis]|uniref:T2SS protein K second SAM-like domain-containing protein n=1 Tax=Phytohabitans rumicis TaxID=1076125 RepID=A0A6V8KT12_9ACTN|nr:helix-hairpin-helix domain-containing protein [Phytohabitans rumicis]GFJ86954.1 hypothetical protein Prum_005960 [Phytohabitans rumicis]